jgi:undecaprenyl-diphosphatase
MLAHLQERFPRTWHWLRNRDLAVLLAVLFIVGGTYGFIALADLVKGKQTQRIDDAILLSLRDPNDTARPIGPPWLAEVNRDITALGGVAVLVIVTSLVLVYLGLRHMYWALLFVLAATLGGLLINISLKDWMERDRPTVVPRMMEVHTTSFPSGHSLLSATVYLTLGALLARFVPQYRLKIFYIAVALLLTGLVGFSRVFLGVHYPSDVLAGWTAGLVWAVLCWLAARYLQIHGAVEKKPEDGDEEIEEDEDDEVVSNV